MDYIHSFNSLLFVLAPPGRTLAAGPGVSSPLPPSAAGARAPRDEGPGEELQDGQVTNSLKGSDSMTLGEQGVEWWGGATGRHHPADAESQAEDGYMMSEDPQGPVGGGG